MQAVSAVAGAGRGGGGGGAAGGSASIHGIGGNGGTSNACIHYGAADTIPIIMMVQHQVATLVVRLQIKRARAVVNHPLFF